IVGAPFPIEAYPVIRHSIAVRWITDIGLPLPSVINLPVGGICGILTIRSENRRQRGIESRIGKLLRKILAVHLAVHRTKGQVVGDVRGVVEHSPPEQRLGGGSIAYIGAGLVGVVVEIVIPVLVLVRALERCQRQDIAVIDVPVQLGINLRIVLDIGIVGGGGHGLYAVSANLVLLR